MFVFSSQPGSSPPRTGSVLGTLVALVFWAVLILVALAAVLVAIPLIVLSVLVILGVRLVRRALGDSGQRDDDLPQPPRAGEADVLDRDDPARVNVRVRQ